MAAVKDGLDEYLKAKKSGEKAYKKAVSAGRYPYLPALDEFLIGEDIIAENQIGLREIPLYMIAGTKTAGRQNAFACNFMPLMKDKSEFAWKWIALYQSQLEEGIRDPIKVYEYMHKFYVEEGNKRVSVMSYINAESIPAYITRLMPKHTDEKENKIYYEYVEFEKVTNIVRIVFSEEGRYKKLAELFGEDMVHMWDEENRTTLKATYIRFREAYLELGGESQESTCGDAYLIYLSAYGIKSLMNGTDETIHSNIERIWKEFRYKSEDDKIRLIEKPDELERNVKPVGIAGLWQKDTTANKLKIAFIYSGNDQDSSWVYGHELGRQHLSEIFGENVSTMKFENCTTPEKTMEAIDLAAMAGVDLIFTTTVSQVETALRAAVKHPEIRILNCSVNTSYNSIRTYYGRMYEAKFLMGALAASLSRTDKIGYVADYPIYGCIANINAFAIGAAMVNPEAKVYLKWSTVKDSKWNEELAQEATHYISGPELIRPSERTREFGVYKVENGEIKNLAMPVWDWGKFYERIVRSVMKGSFRNGEDESRALNYWWGMSAGVIDVILSNQIPYETRKMVEVFKRLIITESFSPFDGELRSQEGLIQGAGNGRLTSEQIVTMDWLNDNVIGSIPSEEELIEKAREIVRVAGVKEE